MSGVAVWCGKRNIHLVLSVHFSSECLRAFLWSKQSQILLLRLVEQSNVFCVWRNDSAMTGIGSALLYVCFIWLFAVPFINDFVVDEDLV